MQKKNKAVSDTTWETLEKELFTPEEIEESNKRVAHILSEMEPPREKSEK